MSPEAIAFPRNDDLSGLRLEQTVNGNVVTPWFSFALDPTEPVYGFGSRYQSVVAQSVAAFARTLGIYPRDVIVTEKRDNSDALMERWWRLGTRRPYKLPERTKPAKLGDGMPAIDI